MDLKGAPFAYDDPMRMVLFTHILGYYQQKSLFGRGPGWGRIVAVSVEGETLRLVRSFPSVVCRRLAIGALADSQAQWGLGLVAGGQTMCPCFW